jgi:RNA polymerase sigma-70 factor (ECF subfamily)
MADLASFDAFYLGARARLTHQVYAVIGDLSEAQDVCQEAFSRAWLRWNHLNTYDNPEAWVRTVALRLATSQWRRARNRIVAQMRHGPPPPAAIPSEDSLAIIAALRTLPYEQRLVIVLHHLVGRSVAEVAAELGVPVGTVKARLSRGRRALVPLLSHTIDDPIQPKEGAR